ncbi:Intrinsic membrane protein PufX [Rhodobacteraceae bacterium THAF1]|uniref:RC-LH1 core complex protein PufX n=1 Tax=Palleronia sp. THAF1 TaxID=2587842 RepID=UPI000F3F83BE|nr:RC-LH1 core complex protein PufX [Palleronia sp. THAF1]QFU09749.1 Intrinsic membrane protein PufX [Palleronia sp. THAF1]VDC17348.1 Intrinsic membrane protein PufX [Rhodobacteraceae bacterium THAF1]
MSDMTESAKKFAKRQDQPSGWHLEHDTAPSLYSWVALQMGKGAFYAAVLFFGVVLFIYALRLLSRVLPEDPYAAIDAVQRVLT